MTDQHYDVVIIGAGVGGLCAAALLAHRGLRPLVIERLDRVGGRASTEEVDGFLINTGAVGLERGGEMEALFAEVGALYDVPEPKRLLSARWNGRTIPISGRFVEVVVDGMILRAGAAITRRKWPGPEADPENAETFEEWLTRFTKNDKVHRLARNITASFLSVNPHEVTARAMLTYVTQKGAFRRFGYIPGGTVRVLRALAERVEQLGGEVWLDSSVSELRVEDGRVRSAVVERQDGSVAVAAEHFVSNAGPRATIALVGADEFPNDYVATVEREQKSAAMICVHLATREPLMGDEALLFFTTTTRLCALVNLSSTAPDVAPPGWRLYIVGIVPDPAVGDFDNDTEIALAWEELLREVPEAANGRIIATRVARDEWPCQRAVIGRDLPRETPIPNLWNVGDAVREYPNAGTQGCAESARLVVAALTRSRRAARPRSRTRVPTRASPRGPS